MVLLRCGPCKGWSRSPRIFLIKATLGQLLQGSGSVRFDLQALHTSWLKQQDTPHWPRRLAKRACIGKWEVSAVGNIKSGGWFALIARHYPLVSFWFKLLLSLLIKSATMSRLVPIQCQAILLSDAFTLQKIKLFIISIQS
ncbi:hypothetical protein V8B55DRAFT_1443180 [Mucor lusitanicus]